MQVECHPYLIQRELRQFCTTAGIHFEAYSSLGHQSGANTVSTSCVPQLVSTLRPTPLWDTSLEPTRWAPVLYHSRYPLWGLLLSGTPVWSQHGEHQFCTTAGIHFEAYSSLGHQSGANTVSTSSVPQPVSTLRPTPLWDTSLEPTRWAPVLYHSWYPLWGLLLSGTPVWSQHGEHQFCTTAGIHFEAYSSLGHQSGANTVSTSCVPIGLVITRLSTKSLSVWDPSASWLAFVLLVKTLPLRIYLEHCHGEALNYRPAAPSLYEVASHVKTAISVILLFVFYSYLVFCQIQWLPQEVNQMSQQ